MIKAPGLDHRQVTLIDGYQQQPADSRKGEDLLDHDDATDQVANVERQHGDRRQQARS